MQIIDVGPLESTNDKSLVKMDSVFDDFKKAYSKGYGYELSMTLSPIPPASDPDRLRSFFRSTNHASAKTDFKYQILYDNSMPFKLPIDEGNGWVEVYFAYWKAVGAYLNSETASRSSAKVRSALLKCQELVGSTNLRISKICIQTSLGSPVFSLDTKLQSRSLHVTCNVLSRASFNFQNLRDMIQADFNFRQRGQQSMKHGRK